MTVAGGPSVTIQADPDQLEQLLINLFRNAVDATLETRGGVTVSWDLVDGRVRLRVDDEGPGLSNTTNLFVPFFTTKPGGSGIGLVLCRQIAEAHGGTLTLENRTPGPGCRAELTLPLWLSTRLKSGPTSDCDLRSGMPLSRAVQHRALLAHSSPAARQSPDPLPEHAARVVSYSIDVSLDSATHKLTGDGASHLAQPVERPGHRAEAASLPERVPEQPLDLHARVRRPVARRRHARERLGLDRPDEAGARRRHGPAEIRRLRRAGRRQCGRPDRDSRATALAGRPGRRSALDRGIHGAAAPHLRPVRLRRRLSPRRPVVPEAGRLRAGGAPRAPGWRLELPPVPRQLRVLRRLRQLRRANHGAVALRRRRDGQASGQDAATAMATSRGATRRTTSTTSGGRPIRASSR